MDEEKSKEYRQVKYLIQSDLYLKALVKTLRNVGLPIPQVVEEHLLNDPFTREEAE